MLPNNKLFSNYVKFLILSQLGFCCVYLVFVPTNLEQIVKYYYPHTTLSVQILMCIILLPMIIFCLIKNLKVLAPFSTIANSLMILSIAFIFYELFFNGSFKEVKQLDMIAPFSKWPIYFSSTIYAFEGISLVLPVHHEMRNKERFSPWNGVLNTAMAIVSIMYFSVGFFGYLKYGQDSDASVTLNLPAGDVLCQVIKVFFSIGIFISYSKLYLGYFT
jgi:proton-coupled amino acid transporter